MGEVDGYLVRMALPLEGVFGGRRCVGWTLCSAAGPRLNERSDPTSLLDFSISRIGAKIPAFVPFLKSYDERRGVSCTAPFGGRPCSRPGNDEAVDEKFVPTSGKRLVVMCCNTLPLCSWSASVLYGIPMSTSLGERGPGRRLLPDFPDVLLDNLYCARTHLTSFYQPRIMYNGFRLHENIAYCLILQ